MKTKLTGSHVCIAPQYTDFDESEYNGQLYIVEVAQTDNEYIVDCYFRIYAGDTAAHIESGKEFGAFNVCEFYRVF